MRIWCRHWLGTNENSFVMFQYIIKMIIFSFSFHFIVIMMCSLQMLSFWDVSFESFWESEMWSNWIIGSPKCKQFLSLSEVRIFDTYISLTYDGTALSRYNKTLYAGTRKNIELRMGDNFSPLQFENEKGK